jgi:predicted acylesterase/phospholipase RssA
MREFWTNVKAGTFVLQWFWDGGFVTNLPRWFIFLGDKAMHPLPFNFL